ncbi:MAG: hypothetical protein AAB784_01655 [Patescibacteria group bacterium]
MSRLRKDVAARIVNFFRVGSQPKEADLKTLVGVSDAAKSSVVEALRRLTTLGIVMKNDSGVYSLNDEYGPDKADGISWRFAFKTRIPRKQKNFLKTQMSMEDLRRSAEASRVLAEKTIEACNELEGLEKDKAQLIVRMNEEIADLDYSIAQVKRRLNKIKLGQIDNLDETPEYLEALNDFKNKGPVVERPVKVLVDNRAGATIMTSREVAALAKGMDPRQLR